MSRLNMPNVYEGQLERALFARPPDPYDIRAFGYGYSGGCADCGGKCCGGCCERCGKCCSGGTSFNKFFPNRNKTRGGYNFIRSYYANILDTRR